MTSIISSDSQSNNTSTIPERILGLKPYNRSNAAKAAAAYIPSFQGGVLARFPISDSIEY